MTWGSHLAFHSIALFKFESLKWQKSCTAWLNGGSRRKQNSCGLISPYTSNVYLIGL